MINKKIGRLTHFENMLFTNVEYSEKASLSDGNGTSRIELMTLNALSTVRLFTLHDLFVLLPLLLFSLFVLNEVKG